MLRPLDSRALARARTSNAVSVPSRPMRSASGRMAASLDLALEADTAFGSDAGRVWRAGGKHHPIAGPQRQCPAVTEHEIDRALRAIQELVVRVRVLLVAVSRSVRPSVDVAGFGAHVGIDLFRAVSYTHLTLPTSDLV